VFTKILRLCAKIIGVVLFAVIVLHEPLSSADPAASRVDTAKEDLTRIDFPSQRAVPWRSHFMRPQDTAENLFGADWPTVARFNRIDRRHLYPGITIKVPLDLATAKNYTPMPTTYDPAKRHDKYILFDLGEQWLGAYEHGKLKFSMPAASGKAGTETPTGIFRIDARHRNHTSSLYQIEDQSAQYPMDNAMRFYIGPDNVAYWLHARDLPGRPASHGCVGLFDEAMQNRMFSTPEKPALLDSRKLYDWAVGKAEYEDDTGDLEELEDGPVVEIIGRLPEFKSAPLQSAAMAAKDAERRK
jgi:hypothetical protein